MSNDHVHPIFQPILAGIARSARISDHTFRIGHPSYQGANALLGNLRAAEALLALMRRNVARGDAQQALADAAKGSHITVCNSHGDVIEVVAEMETVAVAPDASDPEQDEPGDPDGECFHGGEYAAWLAAEQDQARRLK